MAFLVAVLLFAFSLMAGSLAAKGAATIAAVVLIGGAIAMNVAELRERGVAIGLTAGRQLPIAGLNFSALLTFASMLLAVLHLIQEVAGP